MIGKIYRRKGMIDRALQHFTKALDLDPKDTNMVKSLIDKIHSSGPGGMGTGLGNDLNDDDADIQIL
jgi:tetratricopeptide (TPR) repeat protein